MRNTLEIRLGIFFVLALIAAVLVLELSDGLNIFKRGYHLRARFQDLHELKVGDPVKMGGYRIGQVKEIGLGEARVEVLMRIDQEHPVRSDSQAAIDFKGLMGQNYVSLSFGSPEAPQAEEGTVLETVERPDLGRMMAKIENVAEGLDSLTAGFTGEGFGELMGPLTDFIKQNQEHVNRIIRNAEEISNQVAAGEGSLGRLIHDEQLYESALAAVDGVDTTVEEIREAARQGSDMMDRIRKGEGTVGRLMTDERLFEEAADAMSALREILGKINQGEGTVGRLVNDDEFYNNLRLTLRKLERATDTLEDTGPMSVMGTAAGTLF